MNINLLAFVRTHLSARAVPLTEVSSGSGVPYETLKKIASGATPNPGVLHVQRLADYFQARDAAAPAPAPLPPAAGQDL